MMIDVFDRQSLRIFCGPDLETIEKQYAEQLEFGSLVETYPKAEMADCYRNSVEQGIEINEALWKTLDDLVAKILVESTADSRAGAGD